MVGPLVQAPDQQVTMIITRLFQVFRLAATITGALYLLGMQIKVARHDATTTSRFLSDPTTRIEVLKSPSAHLIPSSVRIEILSPKNPRKFQYSVILLSSNNYTGVATLITEPQETRPYPPLTFEWNPVVAGEYDVLVHEVPTQMEDNPEEVLPIDRFVLTIERKGDDTSIHDRLNRPPCFSLDEIDVYSTWDGDWIGPGLNYQGDALRNGWMFVPGESMNCTISTYTQDQLLNVEEETSIFVLGTSRERGVFLSLLDILLSPHEKENLDVSVIGKCWGRATVQKGNIKLLYQDFRVIHFEPPGATRTMECHNDKIAKMGDALFIDNAWKVWDELFEEKNDWPDVVYMLTNDGPNYDFEYHTKSFVNKLPPSWNGTLVLSDGSFTAKRPSMEYKEKHISYRSELKEKLILLDDRRVRWIDGMGVSKEMRLHGEWGEDHMAQSQHFHHFCNDTVVDSDGNDVTINVCSNITEMVAQLLLGHALGPKESMSTKSVPSERVSNPNTDLRYCHACPKRLLPFHITPSPDMTCELGPLHERSTTEELVAICSKNSELDSDECPESCMREEVSYQFDSQSDVVDVRECAVQTSDLPDEAGAHDSDGNIVKDALDENNTIPLWLRHNLADVYPQGECNESDLPFYWNIPESGGTTIQNLYFCMGLTLANEIGGSTKFVYNNETKLVKFVPFHGEEWSIMNVDTSTKEGILRAKDLGMISSNNRQVDLVVSPHLRFAAKELFDSNHKGKVFTIFRHPVSRVLSHHQSDAIIDNWVVRSLVGKEDPYDIVTAEDLKVAKEIVQTKIFVGLENRYVKSFDRFNAHLGIKIHKRWTRGRCIREFVHTKDAGAQQVDACSDRVQEIAKNHSYDVLLYEYAEGLFNTQEIESQVKSEDLSS